MNELKKFNVMTFLNTKGTKGKKSIVQISINNQAGWSNSHAYSLLLILWHEH